MHIVPIIEGLNQRGGRLLTAADLLAAGTVDEPLVAYLLYRLRRGASVLTCAGPGGTGKTTLLGTLLCFLPASAELTVVSRPQPDSWYAEGKPDTWFLCHELGSGPWYAYLWGTGARSFLSAPLTRPGCFCATTVHADTLAQLHSILVGPEIGLAEQAFRRLDLILFMQARPLAHQHGYCRRVTAVYAASGDPGGIHHLICRWDQVTDTFLWSRETPDDSELRPYLEFVRSLVVRRITGVAEVRREAVSFYAKD